MLNSKGEVIRRGRPKWPDKFDRTNAPWKLREGTIRPVMKFCIQCRINRVWHHHILCDKCWRLKNKNYAK